MNDRPIHEAIFPRGDSFGRALLRIVNLAEQRGFSLEVDGFRASVSIGEFKVVYELELFGRTTVRRYRRERLEAKAESHDFDQGLDLFERYVEEIG